ncbi:MAG: glycosyltransferase [Mediterranea sp.]|jgi:glycosyltransferase involved in cell wall biosynthesis|nr:glycosyltransferase [Mediterranea sp.]
MRNDNSAPCPTPLFSIITVTYNAGDVLERTIRSVREQTFSEVEHLIIDGASSDDTLSIIARYRRNLSTVVSEPDDGLYDAMNKGIQQAKGHYLCFLNAGDRFHAPDTLERMAASLPTGTPLPDVLYGDTDIVDAAGHFLHKRRLSPPEKLTWHSFRQGMLVCHQAFFASRELAAAEPYDLRYRYSADFDWCIRIMKRATNLFNTRLTLIDYLDEGITTRHHKASLCERFHIMAHYYGWIGTAIRHIWFLIR